MIPEHRRLIHGRTFAEMWNPARYGCAVEVPTQSNLFQRVGHWFARWFT